MLNSPFERFLGTCRKRYMAHLAQATLAAREQHPDVVTELALRLNCETENERFALVRIDLAWTEDNTTELANAELDPLEGPNTQERHRFSCRGIEVAAQPFGWHACSITLTPTPHSWEAIWRWFDDWFDIEERRPPDDAGFGGVVHRLSKLDIHEGSCQLLVDFGSAPVSAVTELLAGCRSGGVESATLE